MISRLRIFILTLFSLASFLGIAFASSWSESVQIVKKLTFESYPHIAIENDNLHLIYDDRDSQKLFYKFKPSNKTWPTSAIEIAKNYNDDIAMRDIFSMVAYNGKAHVVYVNANNDIMYKTNKSGRWLSTPIKIASPDYLSSISLAQDNGKLYLAFSGNVGVSEDEIFFAKNTNGSWTKPYAITKNDFVDGLPSIAVKNGKVYVAWVAMSNLFSGGSVYYKVFSNGNWSRRKTIISSKSSSFFFNPSIAINNSLPMVAYEVVNIKSWFNTSKNTIYVGFAYRSEGKWIIKNIAESTRGVYHTNPKVAVHNGQIKAVWQKRIVDGSSEKIRFATLKDFSAYWKKSGLTDPSDYLNEQYPDMVIDSAGKSHVIYHGNDNQGKDKVFYKKEL